MPQLFLIAVAMALLALESRCCVAADSAENPRYRDDPAVLAAIENLGPRESLTLPPFTVDAATHIYGSEVHGPVTRGYTLRMAYAPERQTALYHGGDHQTLRSNDVWEYHLGSNTWHMLFEPDGGNHAPMKDVLLFLARKMRERPDERLTEEEERRLEEVRPWWNENVVLNDGCLTTRRGGPILPVHTWDTLVYEPDQKLLIHGTGASPTDAAVLHSLYTGMPLEEIDRQLVSTDHSIWMFDPAARQWSVHRRPAESSMPDLRGMGATMCHIPELGRVLYYVAAQNVAPHAFGMWSWDVATNEWAELHPNGGRSIADLVLRDQVAPGEELQTAYSPRDRKLVAVIGRATFAYDIDANAWLRLNDAIPIEAHDAVTTFAYDSVSDAFLLTDGNREGRVAVYSLADNRWELVTPTGDGCPPSNYGAGDYWGQPKGYFDPRLNIFVVHGSMTDRVWVYRHGVR
jgi:hypothetical protein